MILTIEKPSGKKINKIGIIYAIIAALLLALLGGSGFYLASFFQALAYERLPGSIVTIITQMSAVWSILIGILIFKEIELKKYWKRISVGIIITIISIIILL